MKDERTWDGASGFSNIHCLKISHGGMGAFGESGVPSFIHTAGCRAELAPAGGTRLRSARFFCNLSNSSDLDGLSDPP